MMIAHVTTPLMLGVWRFGNFATFPSPNFAFMAVITPSGVVSGIKYRWYERFGARRGTPLLYGFTLPGSGSIAVRLKVNVGTPGML